MSRHNSHKKIISSKQKEEVYLELHYKYPTKYGFFICYLNYGGSNLDHKLASYDDTYGPFGTLATAQKHFKKYITNRSIDEKHLYSIRGTEYKTDRGFNTIWYATGEEVNYETIN